MAVDLRLPKLSDEMTEATISRWLKDVGESVDKGEPIVEVETEKVIVEVEATQAGVLLEIVAAEQDVVPVDGVLCRIGAAGERTRAAPAKAPPAAEEAPPARAAPAVAAAGGSSGASNVVALRQRAEAPPARGGAGGAGAAAASPLARRVADELGIDLTAVQGSGIGGKVVIADLQPYLDEAGAQAGATPAASAPPATSVGAAAPFPASATPAQPPAPEMADATVPHSALRRTIARRMSEAKGAIPHFYMTAEVDVSEALALRARLNAALDAGRISVNALMIKAAALALEQVPALNAAYADDAVQRFGAVHVGFATAIDEGLVTPVVRDCHLKSIGRIARESQALAERARARTLGAEELQGGTFTISNLGMYDVVEFSAIINPPQVGILAIAQPVERPVADRGRVVFRHLLRATLSADHRAVDGVTGAAFLAAFKAVLEHPERLML